MDAPPQYDSTVIQASIAVLRARSVLTALHE